MTEDEAKKRWCPMRCVAGAGSDGCIDNRGNVDGRDVHANSSRDCLGSGCMAWRWNEMGVVEENGKGKRVPVQWEDGYCGLAGKET